MDKLAFDIASLNTCTKPESIELLLPAKDDANLIAGINEPNSVSVNDENVDIVPIVWKGQGLFNQ